MTCFFRNVPKYFYWTSRLRVYIITNVRQYYTETITKAFKPDTKKMHKELEALEV
jgi:hypothetical protein